MINIIISLTQWDQKIKSGWEEQEIVIVLYDKEKKITVIIF